VLSFGYIAVAEDRSWTVSLSGGSLGSIYRAATIWRLLAGSNSGTVGLNVSRR
jgi:hypothetical protein